MMDNEAKASRSKRWLLGMLVLVIILACALSFLIPPNDKSASYDTESMAQLIAGGPSTQVTAQGLTMTLQISPGPYFLGELLASEITLANTSTMAYTLAGIPTARICDGALWTDLSGGAPPTYALPTIGRVSCPGFNSTLSPGQTWTGEELFPLTASGNVTLQGQARFYQATSVDETTTLTPRTGPFAGWPELDVAVSPTVPAGRTITLHSSQRFLTRAAQVTIDAPAAARSRLYSIDDATCQDPQGSTEAPRLDWRSLTSDTLDDPGCPGSDEVWHYSVGAPGYEIASGAYRANG